MHRDAELLQLVLAFRTAGGFAGLLNGGQKQRNQNRNNCDHNQQLDERETTLPSHP